ncbi:MAG: tetratricopeptide repeat protein [Nitrospirae bacterium]|nr:tetratricopeptide repeat protein [Nitrospirota bacterium]
MPDNPGQQMKRPLLNTLQNSVAVHIACIAVIVIAVYANTLNAPFQWDEGQHLINNPIVHDLRYFAHPSEARWSDQYDFVVRRYVAFLTFALNYKLHGFSVAGYHIVNIAVHFANAVLVYLLLLLTFRTPAMQAVDTGDESRWRHSMIALFSALIFAAHPLQTEAVTYVMQRFASLVAFFYLLSLALYVKFRLGTGRGTLRWTAYAMALLCSILAMKTKENAFTLPFVMALYEFCFFRQDTSGSPSRITIFIYLAPFFAVSAIVPITLMGLNGSAVFSSAAYGAKVFSQSEYLLTQFRVIVTYLSLLILPIKQNIYYDYSVSHSLLEPRVVISLLFLASLFTLGVYMARGRRSKPEGQEDRHEQIYKLIGFGILWFFITLSVESSIIPQYMLINEYRAYLPSVGLISGVVAGIFMADKWLHLKNMKFITVMLMLAVAILSAAAHRRNATWQDKVKLWEDTARKSPGIAAVHNNLCNNYLESNMPDKALEQCSTAVELKPDYADAHINLGKSLQSLNMRQQAMAQYSLAARLKPDSYEAHYNLGVIYQAMGMFESAMQEYRTAVRIRPYAADVHNNLGILLSIARLPSEAEKEFLIALSLRPDSAESHFNLGLLYRRMGLTEKARGEIMKGLEINPGDQRARQLLNEVPQ